MRVLCVGVRYPPHHTGGYELHCRSVVEDLRAPGHAVAVLTSTLRHPGVPDGPEPVRRELLAFDQHAPRPGCARGCRGIPARNAPAPCATLHGDMQARFSVSPRQYRWIAWSALGVLTLIVLTGAAVRMTGSGLGCPTWPKCTGASYVAPLESHQGIEFGNRLLTSVVGLPCFLALVGGFFRKPYRRDFMLLGLALCLSVVAQAILGGITVLTGLNPYTVMGHYMVSMAALALAAVLVWRVERERSGAPARVVRDRRLVRAVQGLFAYGVLMIGVGTAASAAGPHGGGDGTGDRVSRLDFKGADTLEFLIRGHARMAAVYGVLAVLGYLALRRRREHADLLRPLGVVCVLLGLQGIVGNVQYHADPALPAEIVWIHVALAALTFNALMWLLLAAGRPGRESPGRPADGVAPEPERAVTPA